VQAAAAGVRSYFKRRTFDETSSFEKTPAVANPKEANSRKIRATLYLPSELLEQARDATVYLAGYPACLTLARLAGDALRNELRRLKEQYNNGQDFPARHENLRGGRPIAA